MLDSPNQAQGQPRQQPQQQRNAQARPAQQQQAMPDPVDDFDDDIPF